MHSLYSIVNLLQIGAKVRARCSTYATQNAHIYTILISLHRLLKAMTIMCDTQSRGSQISLHQQES